MSDNSLYPRRRLTAEQNRLAEEHWPYARDHARALAYKFNCLRLEWEGTAAEVVCRTAARFDPARGVRFRTLLVPRLKFAVVELVRDSYAQGFRRRRGPAAAAGKQPATYGLAPEDREIADAEAPPAAAVEALDAVDDLCRPLPPRHAAVVRLLYTHAGMTTARAGAALGIHQTTVSLIHAQALVRLRESSAGRKEAV